MNTDLLNEQRLFRLNIENSVLDSIFRNELVDFDPVASTSASVVNDSTKSVPLGLTNTINSIDSCET